MIQLIKHQIQPCPVSCVSTCMAMLIDQPAAEVVEKVHLRYREQGLSLRQMMGELGIEFQSFDTCDDNPLDSVGAYLCTAPSLNIVAGTHQIIVEVTEDDYFVHDPVMGRDDRKFYTKRGQATGDLEVDLQGFSVDAFIPHSWLSNRGNAK